MGVVQHHDAVSGTEKQEIAFDYAERLSDGLDVAQVQSLSLLCLSILRLECHQSIIFKIIAQNGSIPTITDSVPLSTVEYQSMSRDRWTRTSNDHIVLVIVLDLLFPLPVHTNTVESNYSSDYSTCSCTSHVRLQRS